METSWLLVWDNAVGFDVGTVLARLLLLLWWVWHEDMCIIMLWWEKRKKEKNIRLCGAVVTRKTSDISFGPEREPHFI